MPFPTGVHVLVRRTHEERILHALREYGAMSRADISRAVGLSRSTLSDITATLIARGAIIVADTDAATRVGSGRPAECLALDPASGQFLGVDFGHRWVHVAVADAAHVTILSGSAEYPDDAPWPDRIDVAFDLVDRLAAETGVHFGAVQAVAIGVPGPHPTVPEAHPARRVTARPGFHDFATGVDAAFMERFDVPVIVDNNTRFAALAEAITSGDGVDDLVYVRLSDGVGGGIVVGGRLITGATGMACEIGHVTVDPDGAVCRCGKTGCLETVASVPAILGAIRARGVRVETLDGLAEAVRRGHPVVDEVLRGAGTTLGRVLGAVAMTLNPAEIVIGGDITIVAPAIVEQAAAAIRWSLFPSGSAGPVVRAAELADDGGARGALAALFRSSPLLAGYAMASESAPTSAPLSASSTAAHHRGATHVRR